MHQIIGGGGHSHGHSGCDHDHDHAEHSVVKKIVALVLSFVLVAGFWYAYMPKSYFQKGFIVGEVVSVEESEQKSNDLFTENIEKVQVRLKSGENVQAERVIVANASYSEQNKLEAGDKVVVNQIENVAEGSPYQIADVYRLNVLLFLFVLLVLTACVLSGWAAVYSFIGLAFSVLVLTLFIVKGILAGYSPLLVTILGSFLISTVSVYLGHGFNKRTSVAILGIVSTLTFVGLLSVIFVKLGSLYGMGSEEAFFLQIDSETGINLQGIFLAGIIIGTLGVLDDITTSQVAVVNELQKANPTLSKFELYKRSITVGKEHITALINTLVLAYAGASMPLFILFVQESIQPVWSLLNGEFIAEEIVRTLLGSVALILSVPVTTWLAVNFISKQKK